MKKITRSQVLEVQVPLPPLREQQRIAAVLGEQLAAAERVAALGQEQLKRINQLPPTLLREAFSGEL